MLPLAQTLALSSAANGPGSGASSASSSSSFLAGRTHLLKAAYAAASACAAALAHTIGPGIFAARMASAREQLPASFGLQALA